MPQTDYKPMSEAEVDALLAESQPQSDFQPMAEDEVAGLISSVNQGVSIVSPAPKSPVQTYTAPVPGDFGSSPDVGPSRDAFEVARAAHIAEAERQRVLSTPQGMKDFERSAVDGALSKVSDFVSSVTEAPARAFEEARAKYLAPLGETAVKLGKGVQDVVTGTSFEDARKKYETGVYSGGRGGGIEELLTRDFASPILGPAILAENALPPETNLRMVNQLEADYGKAAPFVEAVAQGVGAMPVQLGVYGQMGKAAAAVGLPGLAPGLLAQKVIPSLNPKVLAALVPDPKKQAAWQAVMGVVKHGAGEGAAAGALSAALTPDASVMAGAGVGALMGGALTLGSGAAKAALTAANKQPPPKLDARNPYKGRANQDLKQGFEAYYKDPVTKTWTSGIYRGKQGGKYVFDTRSVTGGPRPKRVLVYQATPVRATFVGDPNNVEIPKGPAWTEPAPKGYVFTREQAQAQSDFETAIRNVRLPTTVDKQFMDPVLSPMLAGNTPSRTQLVDKLSRQALSSRAAIANDRAAYLEAQQNILGGKLYGESADALEQVYLAPTSEARKKAWEQFKKLEPDLAEREVLVIQNFIAERDANNKVIAELLGGSVANKELMRDLGMEDMYLRKLYRNFHNKTEYFAQLEKSQPGIIERAKRAMIKDMGGYATAGEIGQTLREALHHEDVIGALRQKGTATSTNMAKILSEKKDLSPEYRALLGEETSGPIRMAATIANQRATISMLRIGKELVESGLAAPFPVGDLQVPLPDNAILGIASGTFTSPEIAKAFPVSSGAVTDGADQMALALTGGMNALTGAWKASKTIYNPGSWMMNGLRNIQGGVTSGVLDLTNLYKSAQYYFEAVRLLGQYRKDPSALGPAQDVNEARSFGTLPAGMAAVELSHTDRRLVDAMLRHMQAEAGTFNALTGLERAKDFIAKQGVSKHTELKVLYDTIDNWNKLASYLYNREKFELEGLPRSSAAYMASVRVRESYPDYANPNRLAAAARKAFPNSVGVVAPFLTAATEDQRIAGTVVAKAWRAARNPEDPYVDRDLIPNLIKFALAFGALKTLLEKLYEYTGGTPTETKAYKLAETRAHKSQVNFSVLAPYYDEKGRRERFNLTPMSLLFTSLKGSDEDHPAMTLLSNVSHEVLGGNEALAGSLVKNVMEGSGAITPAYSGSEPYRLGEGMPDKLKRDAAQVLLPGAVNRMLKAKQRMDAPTLTQEQWTPRQAFLYVLGAPFDAPVSIEPGSPTQVAMGKEAQALLRQLHRELGPDLVRRVASGRVAREDIPRLVQVKVGITNKRVKDYLDAVIAASNAQQGVPQ